jgi:hypothetical protein
MIKILNELAKYDIPISFKGKTYKINFDALYYKVDKANFD